MTLVMDTREPRSAHIALIGAIGPSFTSAALPCADYVITDRDGCTMGIERKTVTDLLGSLADSRLWSQMGRVGAAHTYPTLLIEGQYTVSPDGLIIVGKRETKWNYTSVQMALVKLQQLHHPIVLWSPGLIGTTAILRCLEQRASTKCLAYT